MADQKLVAYYRVSTKRQGASGLGLDAQNTAVETYARATAGRIIRSFTEVESGKRNDRPELAQAITHVQRTNARLVIARLDRLSRNAAFLLNLMQSKVRFVAGDMPEADETMVGVMALMAQREAKLISERTRAALRAAKARGVKLGTDNLTDDDKARGRVPGLATMKAKADTFAHDLAPVVRELREAGWTLREIARLPGSGPLCQGFEGAHPGLVPVLIPRQRRHRRPAPAHRLVFDHRIDQATDLVGRCPSDVAAQAEPVIDDAGRIAELVEAQGEGDHRHAPMRAFQNRVSAAMGDHEPGAAQDLELRHALEHDRIRRAHHEVGLHDIGAGGERQLQVRAGRECVDHGLQEGTLAVERQEELRPECAVHELPRRVDALPRKRLLDAVVVAPAEPVAAVARLDGKVELARREEELGQTQHRREKAVPLERPTGPARLAGQRAQDVEQVEVEAERDAEARTDTPGQVEARPGQPHQQATPALRARHEAARERWRGRAAIVIKYRSHVGAANSPPQRHQAGNRRNRKVGVDQHEVGGDPLERLVDLVLLGRQQAVDDGPVMPHGAAYLVQQADARERRVEPSLRDPAAGRE